MSKLTYFFLCFGGGDKPKNIYWEGGHRTYFLDVGYDWDGVIHIIGGGTQHHEYFVAGGTIGVESLKRKQLMQWAGWMGRWVV